MIFHGPGLERIFYTMENAGESGVIRPPFPSVTNWAKFICWPKIRPHLNFTQIC